MFHLTGPRPYFGYDARCCSDTARVNIPIAVRSPAPFVSIDGAVLDILKCSLLSGIVIFCV